MSKKILVGAAPRQGKSAMSAMKFKKPDKPIRVNLQESNSRDLDNYYSQKIDETVFEYFRAQVDEKDLSDEQVKEFIDSYVDVNVEVIPDFTKRNAKLLITPTFKPLEDLLKKVSESGYGYYVDDQPTVEEILKRERDRDLNCHDWIDEEGEEW